MRRLMSHVSGHSIPGADGKASLPEGWYTSKIFGSDYFAARFECQINRMVTQAAIGSMSLTSIFSQRLGPSNPSGQ